MTQSQRRLVLGAVGVGLLVLAVVLATRRSGGPARLPSRTLTHGVCLACKQEVDVERAVRSEVPFRCPQCGERAVYRAFYCDKCRLAFVPDLHRNEFSEYPKPPAIPSCPKCGNARVKLYDPKDPDQQPEGELRLPPWPQ